MTPRQLGPRSRSLGAASRTRCQEREKLFVGQREAALHSGDGLHADVIRARLKMGVEARADGLLIAPHDQGIDEPIRAAILPVGIGESEAVPIVVELGKPR